MPSASPESRTTKHRRHRRSHSRSPDRNSTNRLKSSSSRHGENRDRDSNDKHDRKNKKQRFEKSPDNFERPRTREDVRERGNSHDGRNRADRADNSSRERGRARDRGDERTDGRNSCTTFASNVRIKEEPTSDDDESRRRNRRSRFSTAATSSASTAPSDSKRHVKKEKDDDDGAAAADGTNKPKEKINFGLSGKLAEDTNVFNGVVIKYNEPTEARKPGKRWRLYPFKGDQGLPILPVHRQSAYLLGRDRKIADIPIDHPSCSKQHAVLQYRAVQYTRDDGRPGRRIRPYIIDLESANGTFVNNVRIESKRYVELMERDVVKFGFSSREYVLLHEGSATADDDVDQDDQQTADAEADQDEATRADEESTAALP